MVNIAIMEIEHLQYPIGRFDKTKKYQLSDINYGLSYLKDYPALLEETVSGLDNDTLLNIYRPGGWNIRQLVHHLADSHSNMYIRVKCALTEDNPTIKGYDEAAWAELPDSQLPLDASLNMLKGIHQRLVALFEDKEPGFFEEKSYYHAGYKFTYPLSVVIPLYQWHSEHHLEHIRLALNS